MPSVAAFGHLFPASRPLCFSRHPLRHAALTRRLLAASGRTHKRAHSSSGLLHPHEQLMSGAASETASEGLPPPALTGGVVPSSPKPEASRHNEDQGSSPPAAKSRYVSVRSACAGWPRHTESRSCCSWADQRAASSASSGHQSTALIHTALVANRSQPALLRPVHTPPTTVPMIPLNRSQPAIPRPAPTPIITAPMTPHFRSPASSPTTTPAAAQSRRASRL